MGIKLSDLDPETRKKVLAALGQQEGGEERTVRLEKAPEEPAARERREEVLAPAGGGRVPVAAIALLALLVVVIIGAAAAFAVGNPFERHYTPPWAQARPPQTLQAQVPVPAQTQTQVQAAPGPAQQASPQVKITPQATADPAQQAASPAPAAQYQDQQTQGLFRAVITGTIKNYTLQENACRIPVTVGVEAAHHNDNYPYGTLNNLSIISVSGMIDTGAAQTLLPNWVLQQQGWRPQGKPVSLQGIGSGPLKGYVYYIPSPYIWSGAARTYVQLRKNTMIEVWGVEGFDQALIGPDILRYCSFNITGNTWVLGVR